MDVNIATEEEKFIQRHAAAGATQAFAGASSRCGADSAECGGECWGTCVACGPPRYCICYPNGYTGVSGQFHPGAACLKFDGAGTSVEAPKLGAGDPHYKAFAGGDSDSGSGSGVKPMPSDLLGLAAIRKRLEDMLKKAQAEADAAKAKRAEAAGAGEL